MINVNNNVFSYDVLSSTVVPWAQEQLTQRHSYCSQSHRKSTREKIEVVY